MTDIQGHRPDLAVVPNVLERTVRVVRDVAAIVALLLVSLLMVLALRATAAIGDRLDQVQTPAVTDTGCLPGDEGCGD